MLIFRVYARKSQAYKRQFTQGVYIVCIRLQNIYTRVSFNIFQLLYAHTRAKVRFCKVLFKKCYILLRLYIAANAHSHINLTEMPQICILNAW